MGETNVVRPSTSPLVPPLVPDPQQIGCDVDNDDNSSSLSPINSPKKRAKREHWSTSTFVSDFKMNHNVENEPNNSRKRRKYNTRRNKIEEVKICNLSDGNSLFSFSSNSSSDVNANSLSSNTWIKMKKLKIPKSIIQKAKCPIFGCRIKQRFKNEATMKQHIENLHDSQSYFLCKVCKDILYCSKADFLRNHQCKTKKKDSFIPSRNECKKALKTALLIDDFLNNENEPTAIDKMADLILFGCKNDTVTMQTMKDIDCIHAICPNEEPIKTKAKLKKYAKCIDQKYFQHISSFSCPK